MQPTGVLRYNEERVEVDTKRVKTLFQKAGRMVDVASTSFNTIAGIILGFIAISICYDVIMRYIFEKATTWAFPFSTFGLLWLVLLGIPLEIKEEKQLTVQLLVLHFSEKTTTLLNIVNSIVGILFLLILGYFGLELALDAKKHGVLSGGLLNYPMWYLYMAFPVSSLLCCLQTISVLGKDIGKLKDPALSGHPGKKDNAIVILSIFTIGIALGVFFIHASPVFGLVFLSLWLLFGGCPIAYTLGCTGAAGLFLSLRGFLSLQMVPVIAEPILNNFILLAVPMFLLSGIILDKTGMGELIFDFGAKWVGFLPGGLSIATIMACAVFSAMCGVSLAVAAAMSAIAIPALLSRGYPKELTYGSVGGGALGSLIPPSIGLIIYGYITSTSVGKLFIAAVGPAMITVAIYSLFVILYCVSSKKYERMPSNWKERRRSFMKAILPLTVPGVVLGGIYGGIYTPTEASSVAVVYCLFIGLIYKKISLPNLFRMVRESVSLTSRLMIIAVGATVLTYFITRLGVAQALATNLANAEAPRWMILCGIVFMYLLLGMFLDGLSITVLTVPVLFPVLKNIDMNPYVFGVLLVMLVEVAAITPPIGMNLFVIQSVTGDKLSTIAKGNLPFAFLLSLVVFLVILFPDLCLWLTRVVG